jgi:hypothetical protein
LLQDLAEVLLQRIHPKHFARLLALVLGILASPALSYGDGLPVGGLIGDALKAALLDEGFEQHGGITVAALPIPGQDLEYLAQDVAGQIRHLDLRQDQPTAVVDDAMQIFAARFERPADPLVAASDLPSGGTEGQGSHRTLRAADQVTHLGAAERARTQIMELLQQLIPLARQGRGAGWQ